MRKYHVKLGFNKVLFIKTDSQLGFGLQFAIPDLKKQTSFTVLQLGLEGDSNHTSRLFSICICSHLGRIPFTTCLATLSCQIHPATTVRLISCPSYYVYS